MADTYTTNLNLTKPEPGAAEDTWGISLNDDLDTLDAIFSSTGTSVAMNLDGAVIDSSVIGGTTPAAGTFTSVTVTGNQVIQGDLTVQGTTTTIDTTNLDVKDKNITLNYGTGDTSANANGAGITIQDAVSATEDATILWDTTSDDFNFSHAVFVSGSISTNASLSGQSITVSSSGYGTIEVGGVTGAYIDLKKPNSDDYDLRLITDGTGGVIDTGSGELTLKRQGSTKLATTSTGIDVTGTVTADGLTVDGTSDLNGNVTIGTSSTTLLSGNDIDFQRAGDSYLSQTGGGALNIRTNDGVSNKVRLNLATNGDISFYEDTGTTAKLFWDASTERLGIGTTSPSTALDVTGTVTSNTVSINGTTVIDSSLNLNNIATVNASQFKWNTDVSGTNYLGSDIYDGLVLHSRPGETIYYGSGETSSGVKAHRFFSSTTSNSALGNEVFSITAGGDISFYDDTGTAQGLFWDASAESLGIGTTSPSGELHVSNVADFYVDVDGGDSAVVFKETGGNSWRIGNDSSTDAFTITQSETSLGSDVRLFIANGGNVGIGVSSPTRTLQIVSTGTTTGGTYLYSNAIHTGTDTQSLLSVRSDNASATGTVVDIRGDGTGDILHVKDGTNTALIVKDGGSVGIGTTSPNSLLEISSATGSSSITPTELRISSSTQASDWSLTEPWGVLGFYSADTSGGGAGSLAEISANMENTVGGFASLDFKLQNSAQSYAKTSWLTLKNSSSLETRQVLIEADGGLYVENNVGIGTDSPDKTLHVYHATTNRPALVESGDADALIEFKDNSTTNAPAIGATGNNLIMQTGSAATERMRIDSAGRVGINTTPTNSILDITRSNALVASLNRSTGTGAVIDFRYNGTAKGNIGTNDILASDIYIATGDGSSSTSGVGLRFLSYLTTQNIYPSRSDGTVVDDVISLGTSGGAFKDLYLSGTAYVDTAVGIGETNIDAKLHLTTATAGLINQKFESVGSAAWRIGIPASQTYFAFDNANDNLSSPKVVIDTSGNLLVGKTATDIGTVGHQFLSDGQGDYAAHTSNGTRALLLNRKTSDGEIIDFRKDGTQVGSIGTVSGDLNIFASASGHKGLRLGAGFIAPTSNSTTIEDATTDLGISTARFRDLRLSRTGYFGASVGIGTTSPEEKMQLLSSGNTLIRVTSGTSSIAGIDFGDTADTDVGRIRYLNSSNALQFSTQATERMRIDASGNVGIGHTSSFGKLSIDSNGQPASSGNMTTGLTVSNGTGGTAINIGTYDAGEYNYIQSAYVNNAGVARNLVFLTGSAERMRIDTSGNLLVGKTSNSYSTAGAALGATGSSNFTRDGNPPVGMNRLSSDGSIINFAKDSSTVGSIGTTSGEITIGSNNTGIRFTDAADRIDPWNPASNLARDNAIDLGTSSRRFKDIYATNGTIQTSDINEKQDIEDLSEAETRVAVVAKGLLKKYRWKSAVADKGDDARIHFGIMAQDLQQAFIAEGLDAGDYGMFISSTWTDEATGEEKTRLGVRYNELLAFIIAAI